MKKGVLWITALGIVTVGLVGGPDLWAAPGQRPGRQTVPTRTPTSPPPTATPSPLPTAKPTAIPTPSPMATAPAEATPTAGSSGPLLPEAGGWNVRPHLGTALVVAGLLALAVIGRRV